ncbi:FIG00752753: hypothetical protein [Limosilactobacillus reuteri]|uniref:Uncharacterized protein n=1 Tax=Limosilactobacillus reuteri TaxID=1598 RepID=A0A0U5CU35_LIMRT|nr:FIG00752753: hypothetical protein [Limosilactobacillus reuteri]CUR43873.1 FIG00752753: hypothetical protein [Limosilactobacillus reuteri]
MTAILIPYFTLQFSRNPVATMTKLRYSSRGRETKNVSRKET